MRSASLLLTFCLLLCSTAEIILSPSDEAGFRVGLVLVGRSDVDVNGYKDIATSIQTALLPDVSAWVAIRSDVNGVEGTLKSLRSAHSVSDVYFVAHSMESAGVDVQTYIRNNPAADVKGVIFLSSFLQRNQRPDIRDCLTKAAIQPSKSLKYPLGYLQDGAHTCTGKNMPDFPVPSFTISGELDGIVRFTRIAEAFYTQVALAGDSKSPVVIVKGLNHRVLVQGPVPQSVTNKDLRAEISATDAIEKVASLAAAFIAVHSGKDADGSKQALVEAGVTDTASFLAPVIEAFVKQEGNWFFTGGDDEHGASAWGAHAQELMAEPLATNDYTWTVGNEFRLLSDEDKIPPYYRGKHRPDIKVEGNSVHSTTITQLRFIQVSVTEAGAGLNGNAIIKEEKLGVLQNTADTGANFVSAIEIATKLSSRQLLYNLTNQDAPVTLDDGSRCKAINAAALEWAASRLSPAALARYTQHGLPLVLADDKKPFPPAGPWFIWNYLTFDAQATQVVVTAYEAFFSLDANPYGAGNHYCKLLSPARALEWMLIDSLRGRYI
eukprot:Colp12_sorted_trinity150504_noHs@387